MNNEEFKQCKQKGCNNPVLDGKYCEHCKQKRKEFKEKIIAGSVGTSILGLVVIMKKEVIKKGPKIAAEVIKVISRKS